MGQVVVFRYRGDQVKRLRIRKHVAWLAFAAMWLLVVAPAISQVLTASPHVHGVAATGAAAACSEHADHGNDASTPQPHAPILAKCGYCDLLGESPVVSNVSWMAPAPPPPDRFAQPLFSAPRSSHRHPLVAAPRGPPDADA